MRKIGSLITSIVILIVGTITPTTFASVNYEYSIGGNTYTIRFNDDFQKNVFVSNQKNELDGFIALITTANFTKYSNEIVINGAKIDSMSFGIKNVPNPLQVNGKNLDYFVKKYNGDVTNLVQMSFIENLVRLNVPINNNKNYAVIGLITNDLKSKYSAVPTANSGFTEDKIQKVAESLYSIYRAQLGPMDNFNYKVAGELLDKMNISRSRYLMPNDYTGNVTRLQEDYRFVNDFINGKYDSAITNTYDNLFTYSLSLHGSTLSQSILDSIKLKFFAYKKTDGSYVEFINPITGIMNDGDRFNAQKRNYYTTKLEEYKNDIATNINSLNTYETAAGTGANEGTITEINDTALSDLIYTGATDSDTIQGSSLLGGVTSIASLTTAQLNDFYKNELDTIKKKDIEFFQKQRSFLAKEKAKLQYLLQGTSEGLAILNTVVNSNSIMNDDDVTGTVQTELDEKQVDQVIADAINVDLDPVNDPVNDMFKKIYKKHKILSVNNPLIGSEFAVPPMTMSIVHENSFRKSMKGEDYDFLKTYRIDHTVVVTNSDSNKKGFKGLSFGYSPNPEIITDPISNKNVGIVLGNKRTYYINTNFILNGDHSLRKDDYELKLYAINAGFKNIKIYFNGRRLNIGGLVNLNSAGNVKVTYSENGGETNFMPALWIKGTIK